MLQITCINKSNGFHENPHTAISYLGWRNDITGATGKATRIEMYDFVVKGNYVYVKDVYGNKAYLTTAVSPQGTRYVKTVPDRTKTDNLLSLLECVG